MRADYLNLTTKPFVPVTGKKIPGGAGTQGPNLQVDMFAWGPFKFKFKFKNTLEGGYLGTYSATEDGHT